MQENENLEKGMEQLNRTNQFLKSRLAEVKRENLMLRASMLKALGTVEPSHSEAQNIQGTTLCLAASLGRVDWLQQMAENGAEISARDYSNKSALEIAAVSNNTHVLKFLLSCPTATDERHRWIQTGLDAALERRTSVSAQLLESAASQSAIADLVSLYNVAEYLPSESVERRSTSSSASSSTSFICKLHVESPPGLQIPLFISSETGPTSPRSAEAKQQRDEAQAKRIVSEKGSPASGSPRGLKKLFDNWKSKGSSGDSLTKKDKRGKSASHAVIGSSAPSTPCQVAHCKCKYFKAESGSTCDCGHYRASHRATGAPATSSSEPILQGLEGLKFATSKPQLLIPQDPGSHLEWPKILNINFAAEDVGTPKSWSNKLDSWLISPVDILFRRQIGIGSSATVYEGLYKGKVVAIKLLDSKATRAGKSKSRQRKEMLEEFAILTMAESDHVLRIYGVVLEPAMCLVTEFCAKGTLRDLLDPQEPAQGLAWKLGLELFLQAAKGVCALHMQTPPVVHRDLKTVNLLVDAAMQLKVADFGLSRLVLDPDQQSTLAKLRGTYIYTYAACG